MAPNDGAAFRPLFDAFRALEAAEPDAEALRFRAASWEGEAQVRSWSRRELAERAVAAAGVLERLAGRPGARCLLLAESRPEWVAVDLACALAGLISVPLFPNVEPATLARVLAATGCRVAVVENPWQAKKLHDALGRLEGAGDGLEVLLLDETLELSSGARATLEEVSGQPARTLAGLVAERPPARPSGRGEADPEACVTLCYTPGTEGAEKGVVWTHGTARGLVGALAPALEALDARTPPRSKRERGRFVVYVAVPLAQALGRALTWCALERGWVIALPRSEARVVEDCAALAPTWVVGVPSFFARVKARAEADLKRRGLVFSLASRRLARPATAGGLGRLVDRVAERVMRPALTALYGERARVFVSGGAPLIDGVQDVHLRCGLPLRECYGLVETAAVTHLDDGPSPTVGVVGAPLPGVAQRLGPDGEVFLSGPQVSPGYWRDPEATARVFEGGWFASGDLGALDGEGRLAITGRKRDIIVLANGRTLAPRPIERRLVSDPLISHAFIHGDERDFVSLLVSLDPAGLAELARELAISGDAAALTRHPAVYRHVERIVEAVNDGQPPHARVKKFAILMADTFEGEGLTPTGTLNRDLVERRHKAILDSFYADSF